MHRHQRRRASRIHCHTWSAQIERIGQAVCGDAVRVACACVGVDPFGIVELQARVIVTADAYEYACASPCQTVGRDKGIFKRLPTHFKKEALLRVHAGGFTRRDAEEIRVEQIHVIEKAAEAGGDFSRRGVV